LGVKVHFSFKPEVHLDVTSPLASLFAKSVFEFGFREFRWDLLRSFRFGLNSTFNLISSQMLNDRLHLKHQKKFNTIVGGLGDMWADMERENFDIVSGRRSAIYFDPKYAGRFYDLNDIAKTILDQMKSDYKTLISNLHRHLKEAPEKTSWTKDELEIKANEIYKSLKASQCIAANPHYGHLHDLFLQEKTVNAKLSEMEEEIKSRKNESKWYWKRSRSKENLTAKHAVLETSLRRVHNEIGGEIKAVLERWPAILNHPELNLRLAPTNFTSYQAYIGDSLLNYEARIASGLDAWTDFLDNDRISWNINCTVAAFEKIKNCNNTTESGALTKEFLTLLRSIIDNLSNMDLSMVNAADLIRGYEKESI
jgi:hypothetical protein